MDLDFDWERPWRRIPAITRRERRSLFFASICASLGSSVSMVVMATLCTLARLDRFGGSAVDFVVEAALALDILGDLDRGLVCMGTFPDADAGRVKEEFWEWKEFEVICFNEGIEGG